MRSVWWITRPIADAWEKARGGVSIVGALFGQLNT